MNTAPSNSKSLRRPRAPRASLAQNPATIAAARSFCAGGPILLATVGMAVVALASPIAAEGWEFDRQAILNGEWSRLLTTHLTHWNLNHFLWSVSTFLVLGIVCAWQSVGRTVATLLGAAAAISGALLLVHPGVIEFRGLSGLSAALVMLFAANLWRESPGHPRGRWMSVAALAVTALFLTLVGYEAAGGLLLGHQAAAPALLVAAAHFVGGAVGCLVGLVPKRQA